MKAAIIGLLFVLLAGCGSVRMAYSNGAQLGWWWLDGYFDFSREQTPRAKAAIDRWFDWHRSTQLTGYLPLLTQAQAQVLEPTTPAQVCRWQQRVRDALDPALERALQLGAELLPTLGEAQWRHLEERFEKNNKDMRRDFLQPRPDRRAKEALKRAVDRAEMLYGDLDEPQRRVLEAGVAASPFDPEAWLAERQRRQRETVQTLRRLASERADRDQAVTALRGLAQHAERSPDAGYRAYQVQLADYNCGLAAQLHNATTTAQRQAARERLKGWEEDLRSLAAGPVPLQQQSQQ